MWPYGLIQSENSLVNNVTSV